MNTETTRVTENQEARTAGMVMHYVMFGRGCCKIANIYGLNKATVYYWLKRAGVQTRPRPGIGRDHLQIEFNGAQYTWIEKGYYRKTTKPRSMLHYDVWEFYHEPVPAGCVVIHIDRDWHNNDSTNLLCLTKEEAASLYNPLQGSPTIRRCIACGEPLRRKMGHGRRGKLFWETPTALARRRYCNTECHGLAMKGKVRGWTPEKDNLFEETIHE